MYKKYFIIKTIIDFIFALFILILTSPIFLIVAVAIKIEDGGKIFFYQARTGKNGKLFKCYKFRSMRSTNIAFDKNSPVISNTNSNVTKIGKIIRRLKIDELPQIINILKCEMYFIAPRPLLPVYHNEYAEWELVKFELKPGITGLGQVFGNGHLTIPERKYYDVYYAMHCNFLLDCMIFFKTFAIILLGEKRFCKHVTSTEQRNLRLKVKANYTTKPIIYQNIFLTETPIENPVAA